MVHNGREVMGHCNMCFIALHQSSCFCFTPSCSLRAVTSRALSPSNGRWSTTDTRSRTNPEPSPERPSHRAARPPVPPLTETAPPIRYYSDLWVWENILIATRSNVATCKCSSAARSGPAETCPSKCRMDAARGSASTRHRALLVFHRASLALFAQRRMRAALPPRSGRGSATFSPVCGAIAGADPRCIYWR